MIAMQPQEDTLFTLKEAAQLLRVSRNTAKKFIDQGELQAIRVGTRLKVKRSAIDRYFNKNATSEDK